jgi:hypothetical protein
MASKKIAQALLRLREVVKDREKVTAKTIATYSELLSDLPERETLAAILVCCNEQIFFPAMSEIRRRVNDPEGEAVDAARRILSAVRSVGSYGSPASVLSDSDLNAIDAVGGWKAICMSEEANVGILAAQLRKVYQVISHRKEMSKLLGAGPQLGGLLKNLE